MCDRNIHCLTYLSFEKAAIGRATNHKDELKFINWEFKKQTNMKFN